MSNSYEQYTYRGGEKIFLTKRPDEFVVRALPDELVDIGIGESLQMSSKSARVACETEELELLMERARDLAPTHHAYHVLETDEEFLITDRVFVTFDQSATADQMDEFAGRYGLIRLESFSERDHLYQLTDHTGMNPVKLVVKLTEEEPMVEAADHDLNFRASTAALALPTDPEYQRQWHLQTHFNHTDFDPRSSARCEQAWQILGHYGDPEVVIGVTDDGCRLDHRDFDSPDKFAGWGYFEGTRLVKHFDVDADPAKMYQAGSNHGTSCAGVIAGESDAVLTVGAAPGCKLLPIKWESSGSSLFISDSKLLTAINFVAARVDILSNSWGSIPNSLWAPPVVNRINSLAQDGGRRGLGLLFMWAAGNDNCPILHQTQENVPYTNGWQIVPGNPPVWVGVRTSKSFRNNLVGKPGVMHIAALASTAQRSHYSNYGTGIALCAPSSNSHKYWRVHLAGLGITTATGKAAEVTHRFGGTSSATPLVAGIAALVISANSALTALDVISILKRTASKDLNFDDYPRTPPANFDIDPSWDISPIAPFDQGEFVDTGSAEGTWSPWFGHGRIDAPEAVDEALRVGGGPPPREKEGCWLVDIFRPKSEVTPV